MSTETPCCAHNQVVLKRKNHPGGTCSDYWECYDCGTGFWPAHYNDQLKREVTEFFADLQAAKAEVDDNERWMREVLTDFRIQFDDHKVGRRLAFTYWMAENESLSQKRKADIKNPDVTKAPTLAILCESCGYSGAIDTYLPSMSPTADCRCPKCGSTNNQHNEDYNDRLQRAWNCKHVGTLVEVEKSTNEHPLLKCSDCGCVGLDWSMRGERRPPSPNAEGEQLKRELAEAKAEVERLTKLIEDACGSPLSMAFKVQKWTECEQDRDAWRADAAALAKAGMNCVTCSSDIEGTSSVSVYKAELQDLVTALAHHDELVSRL